MLTCPNCGEENPARARFCLACGAPLADLPAAEERKVVSVLFVDLVGFTAGADRADPEDVRATLQPYHALVTREIERFGGTVEKFVGDAVMAVFGAPIAHEDDPERAVRTALAVLTAIADAPLDLTVRAAVTTGEAVVSLDARPGTGRGIATGDVVNTAARLQSEASPGSLVVGEQTFRATSHVIEYEELPAVHVKGKTEPVSLWKALRARSRLGVDVDSTSSAFVGRERELRLLQDTFDRMQAGSGIQLVTITGEPGVGKTRLLAELRNWVDAREELVRWRQGRCLPYGDGITFWALGEIVKAHAGILESDGPVVAGQKLREAVRAAAGDGMAWLEERLRPLVGIGSGDLADRDESFAAWQRFLEAIATPGPLVLLFEDLHWADTALLEFIERLVDWSSDLPILVLCTARPELYERHSGWGGGIRNATTISLSPLSPEETARLVAELLDTTVLPAETQAALLERAGGNPLYAEEYVRLFLERGSAEELPLPETVHGLIAARLDTLTAERKSLLQDAAVIGKVFWAGALETMGDRDPEDVHNALHQLARKELVRPARLSSVEGQSEYAFWHALIRDVAYGQIPRGARAEKHETAADWLEGMAGDRVADLADLLAYHMTEAIALAAAAGEPTKPELAERAARYLVLAGDRAVDLEISSAEGLYRRAIEFTPPGSVEQGRVLLKLAEATQLSGRFALSGDIAEEAARQLESAGDRRSAARAYSLLGSVYFQLGGAERMQRALHRALELLDPLPPGPEHVEAYGRMATLETLRGEHAAGALEWADRAIALGERLGLRREVIRPYQWRGLMRCELGDAGGIDDLEHARAEALSIPVTSATITSHVNLADAIWRYRGPEAALEIQTAAVSLRASQGAPRPTWPLAESCWTLYDLGRWDELLAVADEVRTFEQTHGAAQPGAMAGAYAAFVLLRRGNVGDAAPLVKDVLAHARKIEDPQVLGAALTAAALLAYAQGDVPGTTRLLHEFEHVTRNRPYFRAQNLTDTVRLACAAGELDLADRLPGVAITAAQWDRLAVLTANAAVTRARGGDATSAFKEVAAGWEALHCRLEHALALRAAGDEAAAGAILAELGVPPETDYTAARTAK